MQVILFLTDCPDEPEVVNLVRSVVNSVGAVLTRLELPDSTASIGELVREATTVVAYIDKGAQSLFYEIGLAHGMGKPVVLLSNKPTLIPYDLRWQQVLSVPDQVAGPEAKSFEFRLRSVLEAIRADPRSAIPYTADGPKQPNFREQRVPPSLKDEMRAGAREQGFRHWFKYVAQTVQEWEVEAAEDPASRGYDLVIWNHLRDADLATLGNPVVVELKAGAPRVSQIRQVAELADAQGLKGVLYACTGKASASVRHAVAELFRKHSLVLVLLDSEDLDDVESGSALLSRIRYRLREFRST